MNPLKTFLTACAFFCSFLSLSAQSYTPMPTAIGTTWGYNYTPFQYPTNLIHTSILSDTIINNIVYHKMSDGVCFRENNKEIFVIFPAYPYINNPVTGWVCPHIPFTFLPNEEVKTFDFNVTNIGDTIRGGYYDGCVLFDKTSVAMSDGTYRLVYGFVNDETLGGVGYVEGVGHLEGLCWEIGHQVLQYLTTPTGYIYGSSTQVPTHSQTLADHIQIYPNPVQNRRFRIQTDDALQIEHIELFNALGQRVLLEQNKRDIPTQEIEIPPLPTGIYSLLLQTDKGRATKKLLID